MDAKLEKMMNEYVANLGVAYIKTHNLHWNVEGFEFKAVHEYLEELYDAYTESMDEAAELVCQKGCRPVASFKEFMELASIEDVASRAWTAKDAIQCALDDMVALKRQALDIRDACEDGDFAIAGFVEDEVTAYDKQIWFMKAMLK